MQVMLRRLWIQITADRKRFGVLVGMLLVGLLLWGRIIVTSNLPRTAVATPDDPGTSSSARPRDGAASTPDKPEAPAVTVALATAPNRDPLVISLKHFPKPTSVVQLNTDDPKSGLEAAENEQQSEARLTEQLRALVGRFKLEAVMQGRPMAVINGKTYRLYSWIPAVGNSEVRFQLVQVRHRSVILECEGRRFKLMMHYPGEEER